MAVNSVLGGAQTNSATQAAGDSLNMTDFMNLMVKELENQDPTAPMDADSFFAQIAQLGTVQGMDQLQQQGQVTQAQALMGKVVTAAVPNADGSNGTDSVTGVVTQLTSSNGNYMLGIMDQATGNLVQVNMNAIQGVAPDGSVADYQGLVGKSVTGVAMVTTNGNTAWGAASGQVSGVTEINNQNYVVVKQANGTSVNMLVGNIRSIGS
jgi:flagellar basal-body rod modification protein FlgD